MSKALKMLQNNVTIQERAVSYLNTIKRNIQRDVIDELVARKEKIEERIFELKDLNLSIDLNAGQKRMTAEDCEKQFKEIIELEFQLAVLTLELKVKQDSFNTYFVNEA